MLYVDAESRPQPSPQAGRAEKPAVGTQKSTHSVWVLGQGREVRVAGARAQRIAAVARLQRGRIARRQLLAIGVTDEMTGALVADGALHRRHRGVYAVGHVAEIPLARETEALLAVPQALGLSHRSAAAVWGIRIPSAGRGRPVDVLVGTRSDTTVPGVASHRSRLIERGDIRIRQGLPVTSPVLTLLDIATVLNDAAIEVAFDDTLTQRLVRAAELDRLLARSACRAGSRALRELRRRESEPALTRSGGERAMLRLLRGARLPAPQVNAKLHGFTVDFYWPAERLVVELDGLPYHSTRRAVERDRRKDQVLRQVGLPPLRITGHQLAHEQLLVVGLIARGLVEPRRYAGDADR